MTSARLNRAQPAPIIGSLAETSDAAPGGRRSGPAIVFACDGMYAMQLATALRSVIETNHRRWPLDIHVLTDKFSDYARKKVIASLPPKSAFIRWVAADLEPYRKFATWEHISKVTFARLLIPGLFPETVSRVLYLDADLLVLDDLGPLWEADLEGAVVGAVLDELDPYIKNGTPGLEQMPRVPAYFNAGVLLIDLPRWRKERISERALEYLTQHPRAPFSDQDALNVACDGLWKRLDPRWNFQNHYETSISDMDRMEKPAVVHFVTSWKPWKPRSVSVNASFYDAFRSRTCFARTRREQLSDAVQTTWCRLKGRLGEVLGVRTIRGWIQQDLMHGLKPRLKTAEQAQSYFAPK